MAEVATPWYKALSMSRGREIQGTRDHVQVKRKGKRKSQE